MKIEGIHMVNAKANPYEIYLDGYMPRMKINDLDK